MSPYTTLARTVASGGASRRRTVIENSLHPMGADVEPMLTEADIPWGKGGLSVGVIEYGDEGSYRELARQAIAALARVTAKLDRALVVIVALRAENRALRLRAAA
jgi:hypothetical protein